MSLTKKRLGFLDVFRFAAGYWLRQPILFTLVFSTIISAALVETYLPTALSNLLSAIREQQTHAEIITALEIFLGVYIGQALLFSSTFLTYNIFETRLFTALINDVFTHVYRLPERFFVNTFSGSIVAKVHRARTKIEVFEDQILFRLSSTLVILIGTIGFLTLHFATLALLLLAYVLIFCIVTSTLVLTFSGPAQATYTEAQDEFGANLSDSLTGVTTTKAYAQEEYETQRYFGITNALRIKNYIAYRRGNLNAFVQQIMQGGMLALLLGGGVWYYFQGQASVENMAYLAFAYTIIQSYIRDVGENIKNLLTSSYDLHGVIHLLNETPEVEDVSTLKTLKIAKGAIAFKDVEFTYPEKNKAIFKDLNVNIQPGERIALVGHSGGGKTSFIRLLQCLYTPQKGRILIDGQDIAEGTRQSLRSAIALVPQDPILFHRSLRENIAYAKPEATEADIQQAARLANIEEFILSLPQQYDTLVGERGIKLSGGERQRIAIARAILADRPILILDEATSSLDSVSEKAIQQALHTLTQGRTSIMIAHRLSTILDADRILVFNEGCIVESGSHHELIAQENGLYAGLFKLQSGGFIAD